MNYYEHHLGDYMRDTAHLSMIEDAAYHRLLEAYYIREKALPVDLRECCKLARATSKPERDAVAYVLREFFQLQEDGYHQKRADEEIKKFRAKSDKARASVEARWERERERRRNEHDPNAVRNTNVSAEEYERIEQTDTNVQIDAYVRNTDDIHRAPVPRHQTPERESISRGETAPRARGARLDPGWEPSDLDLAWARSKRPDLDIPETVERFRDYWTAKTGADATKLDWSATWRNWVRNEKAPPRTPPRPDAGAFV